ncbi:MAG: hypothetical protein RLZZ156_489 [Deinococcota bacterium]|jgi:hypothetical protein
MNGITVGLNENVHFAQKARLAFIAGCPDLDAAPIDLVERGERTIDQWVQLLRTHRELETQIYSNWQRERCEQQFLNDENVRFRLLGLLLDGTHWATKSLYMGLQKETTLSYIRKCLGRLLEDGQVNESTQIIRGLEVTLWSITKRGQREYNAHLARVEKASLSRAGKSIKKPHTSASKSGKKGYTRAGINAGQG